MKAELGSDWKHLNGGDKTEFTIDTPSGAKSSRRMDITFQNKRTMELRHENVGRTNADGTPVKREKQALDDVERETGQRPGYTPYDR